MDDEIPAHRGGQLRVEFTSTERFKGTVSKRVWLHTDDPRNPELTLLLQCTVLRAVEVSRCEISIVKGASVDLHRGVLWLSPGTNGAFVLESLESPCPDEITIERIVEHRGSYAVHLRAFPSVLGGKRYASRRLNGVARLATGEIYKFRPRVAIRCQLPGQ